MAAALPLAIAAEPAAAAGAKLAGDVVAHIAAALGTPLIFSENVHYSKRGVTTTKAAVPAWLVVGGAAALWILGLQIGVGPKPDGTQGLGLRQRPPWTFPGISVFGGGGSGDGGAATTNAILSFANDIYRFLPFFPHL